MGTIKNIMLSSPSENGHGRFHRSSLMAGASLVLFMPTGKCLQYSVTLLNNYQHGVVLTRLAATPEIFGLLRQPQWHLAGPDETLVTG